MLSVEASKSFGTFNLTLTFKAESGFTALFGPSGCGKTTTLNMIAGLVRPDDGEIRFCDDVLFSRAGGIDLPPSRRNIGYVFQESRLFPHLSVNENLTFGMRPLAPEQRRFEFDNVAELCGLTNLLFRYPANLSGGERQRVALARAILASPGYLLLDEPLAALDQSARLGFLQFLKQVHHELHLPMLYVSHDLSTVITFADSIIVMQDGRIAASGTPLAVLDQMVSPPLVSPQDVPNILEVTVTETDADRGVTRVRSNGLTLVLSRLESQVGDTLMLNIPASEIILGTEKPGPLSASNIFAGEIKRLYHIAQRVFVEVDTGFVFTVEIVETTVKRLKLELGNQVYLIIKASAFRRLER